MLVSNNVKEVDPNSLTVVNYLVDNYQWESNSADKKTRLQEKKKEMKAELKMTIMRPNTFFAAAIDLMHPGMFRLALVKNQQGVSTAP